MVTVCEAVSFRQNIPFESRIERGILISFCDSFRFKSASLLSYADHMYDLCYVIFMSRREITNRDREGTKWKENSFDHNQERKY